MKMIMTTAALATLLSACSGGGSVSDEGLNGFVESVRANGYAKAYDDGAVKNMAKNVCQTLKVTDGDDAQAEGVLENYDQLSAKERQEMVDVARGTACSEG